MSLQLEQLNDESIEMEAILLVQNQISVVFQTLKQHQIECILKPTSQNFTSTLFLIKKRHKKETMILNEYLWLKIWSQ